MAKKKKQKRVHKIVPYKDRAPDRAAHAPNPLSRREMLLIELQSRQRSREHLLPFCRYCFPGFEDPPHIQLLASYLEKVAKREITRLMIFMPPRHGKTELSSILFPAWYLGTYPQQQIIAASYSEPLAYNNSRACRDHVTSPPYQTLWPHKLDASGVTNWRITGKENMRPNYVAAGAGGAITGEGADIMIIDDPVKNYEEACSVVMRESNWEWYRSVVRTRLQPNAAIILIMTRWHHDDLAGRLLRLKQSDPLASNWTLLVLPSEDMLGDRQSPSGSLAPYTALWPQRYPEKELAAIKADLGSRQYSALYLQTPSDEQGSIIKRDWFKFYRDDPRKLVWELKDVVQSWDMSFKDTSDSSFVVGQVWGRRGADKFLLDQVRKRMDFAETCKRAIEFSAKWPRAGRKMVEDKANGPAVISHLRHILSGLIPMKKEVSKEAALQAASPDYEAGNIYVPDPNMEGNSWVRDYIEELCTFGVSANTDQCDASAQAINYYRSKNSHLLQYLKEEKAKLVAGATTNNSDISKTPVVPATRVPDIASLSSSPMTRRETPHYPTIDDIRRRML